MNVSDLNEHFRVGAVPLVGDTPVRVTVVRGSEFAVLIDAGTRAMGEAIRELIHSAVGTPSELRLVVNTHGHHDHIGANHEIKEYCGALLAAPAGAIEWIEDLNEHYRRFCLIDPDLLPDAAWMREECFSLLGEVEHVDLVLEEGARLRLGGGVELEALSLPGHMNAELGFIEHLTNTLIVGDAVISNGIVDIGPMFHGYQDASAYQHTLARLSELVDRHRFTAVVSGHLPPTNWEGFGEFIALATEFFRKIEDALIAIVSELERPTVGEIWRELCSQWGYREEFRGLATVQTHLELLLSTGAVALSGDGFVTGG